MLAGPCYGIPCRGDPDASSALLSCLPTRYLLQLQLWGEPYQWSWGRAEALLCALGPLLLG